MHKTQVVPIASGFGKWAPFHGPKVCCDATDRWRPDHDYDKDGVCIFCEARRGLDD